MANGYQTTAKIGFQQVHGILRPLRSVRATRCGKAYEALPWCVAWDRPGARNKSSLQMPVFLSPTTPGKQKKHKKLGGKFLRSLFLDLVLCSIWFVVHPSIKPCVKTTSTNLFVKHLSPPGDLWKPNGHQKSGLGICHRVYFRKTSVKKKSLDSGLVTDIHIYDVSTMWFLYISSIFFPLHSGNKNLPHALSVFCLGKHLHSISYAMSHHSRRFSTSGCQLIVRLLAETASHHSWLLTFTKIPGEHESLYP